MILECPSCHARYLLQIGLFAQGGRQVRCARCKYSWHATLPTNMDVFAAPEPPAQASKPVFSSSPASPPLGSAAPEHSFSANLPAVIKKKGWREKGVLALKILAVLVLAVLWPVFAREDIVKTFPSLRGVYEAAGLQVGRAGLGLKFEKVKSELKYDSGTMRLFVTGVVHNTTGETQFVPDIKARALAPDGSIVQSWWVAAPAPTIQGGAGVPFHTAVNAPMNKTIENVFLEFYTQHGNGQDVE
ncbi:MAG: zinc-ribbon domain-containing protein [Alphaproteobacteria bacterium]|nr:zinc-ribbon domain-containing protein [Alphaproteobacteria bacterium]